MRRFPDLFKELMEKGPYPRNYAYSNRKFFNPISQDPRIGQRVKPGDTFPVGSEFDVGHSRHLRLIYENGIAELCWIKSDGERHRPWQGARKLGEGTYATTPDKIVVNPNLICFDATVTKIGSGQPTPKQKKKEEERMEARKISFSELEEMVEAIAEEEFEENFDSLLQEGATFHQNFQSFSDKNISHVFITTARGGCTSPTGKLMFGGALFNDGHVEMMYFIGGQCPWFVYKPKAKWPEGYEQYGAFVWTDPVSQNPTVFVRKGLNIYFSGSGDAPNGFQSGFTCNTVQDAQDYLDQQPSWLSKKNFLKD